MLLPCTSAQARVTRIVIDETLPYVPAAGTPAPPFAYEQVAGRAFGELDPRHRSNAIIQDIDLAKDADGKVRYASGDWAWAKCDPTNPFPGTPDATQICLKEGFDRTRLYQVVFTAANPFVLGVGFAAWRDVGAFFKTAAADDAGSANPLAKTIKHSIALLR